MLLAIDIGNSHTVIGLFKDDLLIDQWRLHSDRNRTDDELAISCHGLLSLSGVNTDTISGIIIASVVPHLATAWISCCRKYLSTDLKWPLVTVSAEKIKDLLQVKTECPEAVGADRLVNAIAGWHKYRCHLLIIDFGTAITFDCVSAQGAYLGGAILPGIGIALEALSSRTAQLPNIDISVGPEKVIGINTVQAMKSGILHGYGSLIDGMTHKISLEMGCNMEELTVIATGGMAHLIAPYAQSIGKLEPLLTLEGLYFIHSRQQHHD